MTRTDIDMRSYSLKVPVYLKLYFQTFTSMQYSLKARDLFYVHLIYIITMHLTITLIHFKAGEGDYLLTNTEYLD